MSSRRGCGAGPRALATLAAAAVALVLLLVSARAHAGEGDGDASVDLTRTGRIDLRPNARLFIDDTGTATFEDVRRDDAAGKLRAASAFPVHLGFRDAAIWLSVTVTAHGTADITRFLRIFHTIDHAEVYVEPASGTVLRMHAGRREPWDERAVKDSALVFPLVLTPNVPTRVTVRLETRDVMRLDLDAIDPEAFAGETARRHLAWGLGYGMLGALGLYNLVLLFWLKDRAYLYYVLFQGSLALLLASFDQLTLQYFWPRSPDWSSNFETVAVMLSAFGACGFVRAFLATNDQPVPGARWLRVCQYAALVLLAGFPWTDNHAFSVTCIGFIVVVTGSVLVTSIRAVARGNASARFFLLAWLLLTVSSGVIIASVLTEWDVRTPMEDTLRISAMAEAVLLSFGLAHRVQRMRAEHERMAKEMLRQRVESLNHLVSGVVHEIANPLHFVMSGAELIAKKTNPPDVTEALDIITNGSRRIDLILGNLRNQATLERPAALEAVDVGAVVKETLALMRTRLADQRIEVTDATTQLPRVMSRPGELGQVFANLFLNACQAMPDGGTLDVRGAAEDGAVTITVTDSGPGVPLEHRGAIFDPFFTTRGPQEGTGLGLYVSLQMLWSHGGNLALLPTEKGARFQLTLPRAAAEAAHAPLDAPLVARKAG